MMKFLAIGLAAVALTACSSMNRPGATMGNAAETKNSTDANKANNPAAVSPGPSPSSGGGSGGASGSGTR